MEYTGNLRKMASALNDGDEAQYTLRLFDVLDPGFEIGLNGRIGERITLRWENEIHCVVTGKKIKKTFGEGMSFDAFRSSPQAVESIIRPELSRIHEGIALRDKAWEEAHHNQPHYVYLSNTSGMKVGVTRTVNVPTRWIDQGAVEAIILAETPYRQLAGEIEVALKVHFNDRTNWRAMLRDIRPEGEALIDKKEEAMELLGAAYDPFFFDGDDVQQIRYPVKRYPPKISSAKLEKDGEITSELVGIKGQYLLFGDGRVFNVRSHAGYRVTLSLND